MKVIIAGSRNFNDQYFIDSKLKFYLSQLKCTELIHGGCRGVDALAGRYAIENDIPYKLFLADWDKYGKSAGPRRNAEMAEYGDYLIVFWDGKSRGTKNMISEMQRLGKKGIIVSTRRTQEG